LGAGEAAAPQHEVAVVVVGVHVRAEAAQAQGQVVAGLELDVDQAALALAGLLEQGRAEQAGRPHADQVGIGRGDRVVLADLEEAARDLLRFAAQLALLAEGLDQHAEGAFGVAVVEQRRQLRIGGVGLLGIDHAQ
jgi:hypothetical protein